VVDVADVYRYTALKQREPTQYWNKLDAPVKKEQSTLGVIAWAFHHPALIINATICVLQKIVELPR
jgi:hypothetical protein